MSFTADQQAKALAALTAKAKPCPTCGHNNWTMGPSMVLLPTYEPSSPPTFGVGHPCLTLVCSKCGNTVLFNVYVLGLAEVMGLPPGG